MSEWLSMGGYAFYVWGSYALSGAALAWNLWAMRSGRRQVMDLIDEEREEA